ncbi:MAG TPA: nucleotidyltransferase family protein [Caulobacteraceae bacterium]|nr:nucleotidyltransferase family protein [Caulobacteraceae bacterium]
MTGLHALVLAAGAGTRFGGRKLLAPFRDGRLIDGALAAALAAPVETVTVVVGYDAQAVRAAAIAFAADVGETRLHVVEAPDHAEGLAGSLRAGIAALPGNTRGALVFLGDMPLVPFDVLAPLAQALSGGAPAAVPVFEGRRGHPAALSESLFPELLALSGDRGARDLLEALGAAVVEVPAPDAGVLIDVDAPADLENLPGA